MRAMQTAFLVVSLLGSAAGQLNAGSPGVNTGSNAFVGSQLCNRTFADANATGIISFNPDTGFNDYNVSWAGTVYQSPDTKSENSRTELSLWFSPDGANYTDNFSLGYDVCYLWISGFPINTYERGQKDTGNCYATLSETCVNDFTTLTNNFTTELVGLPTPPPNSNLSANSLPGVCTDLAYKLTQNFPDSCEPYFNMTITNVVGGPPGLGGALTGNQSLVSRSICEANSTYSLMWTQYGSANHQTYLYANYFVTPIITAFMPIANVARPVTLAYTKSFMNCLRVTHRNPDSEDVPPAPSPTPVDISNSTAGSAEGNGTLPATFSSSSNNDNSSSSKAGLSGGTIAGIVVGVILGVAVIAALIAFLFRKRIKTAMEKRKRGGGNGSVAEMDGTGGYMELEKNVVTPARRPTMEAPESTISEMGGADRMAELGAGKQSEVMELDGTSRYPSELDTRK